MEKENHKDGMGSTCNMCANCTCGMCCRHHGKGRRMLAVIIGLVLVFWLGVKFGEIRAYTHIMYGGMEWNHNGMRGMMGYDDDTYGENNMMTSVQPLPAVTPVPASAPTPVR